MPRRKKENESQGVQCSVDPVIICPLVNALTSENGLEREKARKSLVALGNPEVAIPLMEALTDKRDRVRWEAAKALKELADPATAPVLVRALRDEYFDVRWVAAEALVAMKQKGLSPLLWALVQHSDSIWLREGAHHVLGKLSRGRLKGVLKPVLEALGFANPEIMVPQAALKALEALAKKPATVDADTV